MKNDRLIVGLLVFFLSVGGVANAQSLIKEHRHDGKMSTLERRFEKVNVNQGDALITQQSTAVIPQTTMAATSPVSIYDQDRDGRVSFSDVTYLFNNMSKLSVAQADLNNNDRVDFADVTYLYNRVNQAGQTFSISRGGGGISYSVVNNGTSITTTVAGMTLKSSPMTLNFATGTISYIPYPNGWDNEAARVTLTKSDPLYTSLSGIMKNTVNNLLKYYSASLTSLEKTRLTNALGIITDLTMIE